MNRTMNLAMRQYFAEDGGAGSGGSGDGGAGGDALTFESWHASLGDDHKALIETHTKGLKSALEGERESRKALSQQVADLAKKAEKGSAAEQELSKLSEQLKTEGQRADFFETAHASGVRNLKAAWLIAKGDESLWKRDGTVDLDAFKQSYPELFGSTQVPPGNGGNGNGQGGGGAVSMDQIIRQAAGR